MKFSAKMKITQEIVQAANLIKSCDLLIITAGAGMGVDSGLPDFRGQSGFWRAYPPMEKLGLTFPETSNPRWFFKDPHFAWGFFGHRHNLYSQTAPHEGFSIIKSWVESKEYFIFTSNVDGHFSKAGFCENNIVECHGTVHYLQCLRTNLCTLDIWPMAAIEVDMNTFRAKDPLPLCRHCAGLARPNVLMFGDIGWVSDRTDLQMDRLQTKLAQKRWKITVVEIGAGEAVYTVRAFGNNMVERHQANLIRINPQASIHNSTGTLNIQMKALEALNAINNIITLSYMEIH